MTTIDTDKLTVMAEYDSLHNKASARTKEGIPVAECAQAIKNVYVASLDKAEKIFFHSQSFVRLYYTEIPCDIHTLKPI